MDLPKPAVPPYIAKPRLPARIFLIPLLFGTIISLGGFAYLQYRQTALAFSYTPPMTEQPLLPAYPVKLEIPSASVAVPVIEQAVINGKWQVPAEAAAHVAQSANPGFPGNIIIYGHNLASVLGKLGTAKPGDSILVTTADGKKHVYSVTVKSVVDPGDISVVKPAATETLTVYTCTGFLDSRRLVIQARPF